MRKIIYFLLGLFALLFITILMIPILFKDKIKAKIDEEIAKNVNATVYFNADQFSISLIKNFPNASMTLNDFGVIGKEDFKDDTLMAVKEFVLVADIMSVISGDQIKIKKISLDNPFIQIITLANGKSNYDIYKAQPTAEAPVAEKEPSKFSLAVDSWQIINGRVIYDDRMGKIYTNIKGLNHEGKGDFNQDIVDVKTLTKAEDFTFSMDTTNYLSKKQLDIDMKLKMDMPNSKYTFSENVFKINEFAFGFDGFVQTKGEDIITDISYKAKETSFKNILSLVPGVYTKDFADIKTDGQVAFDGFVKGTYNKTSLPAFALNLLIKDAMLQYPKLPTPVKNINMALNIDNKDGVIDHTIIDLKNLHLEMGKNPIDAKILLKGLKKMDVDGNVKAKLNLGELTSIFPIEGQEIKGNFEINATAKGIYDSITKQMPAISANMIMSNGHVKSSSFPKPLEQVNFNTTVNNSTGKMIDTKVLLSNFSLLLDGDPFTMKGSVVNFEDYTYDMLINGRINLEKMTKIFPLKDMTLKGIIDANINTKGKMSLINAKKYSELPTSGTMNFENFSYVSTVLPQGMKITSAKMIFDPKQISVPNLDGFAGKSDIKMSGSVSNYMGYIFNNELLVGKMKFTSNKFDVNEWMTPDDPNAVKPKEGEEIPMTAVEIPKNLDFLLTSNINQVLYSNMNITNLTGDILIKNGIFKLINNKFNLLDGQFATNLTYNSQDIKKPTFDYDLDVNNLSISKAYETFNVIKKLAPIAKNIDGKFSTKLKASGEFDKNMNVNYQTLSADGLLTIIEGILKDFKLMNGINSLTKMNQPTEVKFKDTKVKTTIKNGRVYVEPFNINSGSNVFNIGGSQGIDKTMDYIVKTDINAGAIGAAATSALSKFAGKDLGTVSKIKMALKVSGTSENPKFSIISTSTEGTGATNLLNNGLDAAKTELKNKATDEVNKLKAEAETKAKAEADRLVKEASDRLVKEAQDKAKSEASQRAIEEAKKLKDRFQFPK